MVASMLDARNDARTEGGTYQRVEVITGRQRRRRWTAEEKARIVAESLEADANISDVARRHGVARGLLTIWRRQFASGGQQPGQSFAAVRIDTVRRWRTMPRNILRSRKRLRPHCRRSGAERESRSMSPEFGSGLRAALITPRWPWSWQRCGAAGDLVPRGPEDHVGCAACRLPQKRPYLVGTGVRSAASRSLLRRCFYLPLEAVRSREAFGVGWQRHGSGDEVA